MNSINYKVIFKGSKGEHNKNLALTFKKIITKKTIKIPAQLILELKKL